MRKRVLDEEWVCTRAGIRLGNEGSVESLSLQGTHDDKVLTLGFAFQNFQCLRSLDLSRNVLISLQGIEYLHALQLLNLYYNEIASMQEIHRLCSLKELKELDLRLNPLTRKEGNHHRLVTIYLLGGLQTLDDRAVRDSERKAAASFFRLKEYEAQQAAERHTHSDSAAKERESMARTSTETYPPEMNRWAQQNLQSREDFNRPLSPSEPTLPETQRCGRDPSDFEDEYRPLPSPTRSSLRSPGKGSTARARESFRVTFDDSSLLDSSPKKDASPKRLENEAYLPSHRKPTYSSPEKPAASYVPRDLNFRNVYLTSTPLRKEIPSCIQQAKAEAPNCNGQESAESNNERLLRLSSDLYVTTHLSDPPLSSAASSTWRKGFSNISKTYTLPSKPSIASSTLHPAKTQLHLEANREYRGNDKWVSGLASPDVSAGINGIKRFSSLGSLLSLPSDRYTVTDLPSGNGLKERDGLAGSEDGSLSSILRQLMDLVDRYWNGSGSLLQNMKFLVPARELLTQLMTPSAEQHKPSHLRKAEAPRTDDSSDREAFKQKVIVESGTMQSELSKLEHSAAATDSTAFPQGELAMKCERLTLQVDLLQQQLRQNHKMQDTVNLLHDSQRSLICTNEYLLQQLTKNPSSYSLKVPPSKESSATAKLLYPDQSKLSAQYRKPERLNQCPL
ncbi:leucine-rich repeat-containing protein 36 [Pelodytes ibericus]